LRDRLMKRLLYIAHRMPFPPDKGDRVRAFHQIETLSQHYEITLATLAHSRADAEAAPALKQWVEEIILARAGGSLGLIRGALSLLDGGAVTEGYFRSPGLLRAIHEACRKPFDLAIAYSSSTLPYLLAADAKARVMDLVDVDSAKWASYGDSSAWPKSWLYRREARGVRALELEALERCDAVLLVSEAEVRALPTRSARVIAVSNGVDMEYFAPADPARNEHPGLVFTGTMDYRPNIDGVCGFVRDVWPGLKERVPGLTFTIVGRNPTRAVKRLEKAAGIRVTGSVPDVRPFLADASMAVVPLRIARGIQNKVLEAMAMGRAVVASGPALEGLDVRPGEDVLRADTTEEWHDQVTRLLSDEAFRLKIERAARRRVEADYSWETRLAPLVALCERLTGPVGSPEMAATEAE